MTTPRISFEFFPPQSLDASFRLWETVQALAPMQPSFVSVTYGAGGTTRTETLAIAEAYAAAGVTEIVALRGDAPKGAQRFVPHPLGFANSVEL
ncbi:MAG: methylenetetrahydrofolate reductase, partial [Tabrizicola sp.]